MDIASYAASWRRRLDEADARTRRRAEGLAGRARVAAGVLRAEFGAHETWLFGSLVWGRPHAASDVDLAVRGIPDEVFYKALARAWEVVGAPVDLVPLDSCPAGLRRRILAGGVKLDA